MPDEVRRFEKVEEALDWLEHTLDCHKIYDRVPRIARLRLAVAEEVERARNEGIKQGRIDEAEWLESRAKENG